MNSRELYMGIILSILYKAKDRILVHAELAVVGESGIYPEGLFMRVRPLRQHLKLERGFRCISRNVLTVFEDLHQVFADL